MAEQHTKGLYKYSLAQWSLNKPMKDGSIDPMDFAKIAKELGFTGLEYVSQLYPEVENAVGTPNYREAVMGLSAKLLEQSKAHGMENVLIMIDHAGELADPNPEKRKAAYRKSQNLDGCCGHVRGSLH